MEKYGNMFQEVNTMRKYKLKMIGIYNIVPNNNKIRNNVDDESLYSLVNSIRNCGIL